MRHVRHALAAQFPAPLSVLGFGCASLLGSASRRQSLAALAAAWESGITFFDTARSYGFGASEGLLGEFLQGRRDKAVVCTKFGILPGAAGWKQHLKPLARTAVRLFPGLRTAVGRQAGRELVGGHFDVATLHTSLHTSLRELRMDSVDMLLMHAAPRSVLEQDDLLEALARLVEAGKVRVAGISGERAVVLESMDLRPPILTSVQFAMPPQNFDMAAEIQRHGGLLLVANHPFGGAAGVGLVKERLRSLSVEEGLPSELREELRADDPRLLPEVILHCILEGTGVSAVLSTMLQPAHIRANVAAVERCRFSPDELRMLRDAFTSAARFRKPGSSDWQGEAPGPSQ